MRKYHLVFVFDKAKGEILTEVLALAYSKKGCLDYMNRQQNRQSVKYRIAEGYSVYEKGLNNKFEIGHHGENLFIRIDKFLKTKTDRKIYYSDDKRVNRFLIGKYIKEMIL